MSINILLLLLDNLQCSLVICDKYVVKVSPIMTPQTPIRATLILTQIVPLDPPLPTVGPFQRGLVLVVAPKTVEHYFSTVITARKQGLLSWDYFPQY